MVYHEIRIVNGKKQNYLVHNSRKKNKWIKNSKFISTGDLNKKEICLLKKEFEKEIVLNKNYIYLRLEYIK